MRVLSALAAISALLNPAFGQDEQKPDAAATESGKITIELNKLEPLDNACHVYFVVRNGTPNPLAELQLDVFLFDKEGVIIRGVAFQFSEVPSGRPSIAPFELPDLACPDIGRLALNKVLACTDSGSAPIEGCAGLVEATTRSDIPFEY